ncbi:hypothetical protein [Pseudoflavonifractor phocaeensis]|uniref:hypothetical protein n=1 Tax=Pseudoflavonifractor phocaeensis TaxID=1870988 RepID=UPI00195BDAB1|nr:hypothetical protein [Pseudoflavonifractor phocaeensis]
MTDEMMKAIEDILLSDMSDRNLTLEQFWKLPEQERGRRYADLSEEERLNVRLHMLPGVIHPLCNICRYYHGSATCEAFPNGIPGEHIRMVMDDPGIVCRGGYHYQQR